MPGPRDYSTATRAALAALSRRRCYFPACNVPIFKFIDGEPYIDYQIAISATLSQATATTRT